MLVAHAIADPVRREILLLLRGRPLAAGEIADRFTISRPAISRHLRVLREAGLVTVEPVGRERMYALDTTPLAELERFFAQLRSRWEQRLDALATEVRRTSRERRRAKTAAAERPEPTEVPA